MNTQFELPSNGKKYDRIAEFTCLEMRHHKHLATYGDVALPFSVRFSAALEVLVDTVKIKGLTDFNELYIIDFDALMLQIKMLEIPNSKEFSFSWECGCKDEHDVNTVNDGLIMLNELKLVMYDNAIFRVGEREFDFITTGNWIAVQQVVEDASKAKLQQLSQLPEGTDVNVMLERLRVKREELNTLFEKKLAASLKSSVPLTMEEREAITGHLPYKYREELKAVLIAIDSYGFQKYIVQKCRLCAKEAHVMLPFQQILKFVQ